MHMQMVTETVRVEKDEGHVICWRKKSRHVCSKR
uniref:Uncharacterized protein n=1 Tax=Populus trichocarpa TaxID=3694 RepID=A0A3N7E9F7_POPTR